MRPEAEHLKQLIQQGADVCAADKAGRTALHEMAKWGFIKPAATLLAAGAHPNARDDRQRTPLHAVIGSGYMTATPIGMK